MEVKLKAGGGLALTSSSLGRTVGSWFLEVWFEDQRYLLLPELTSVCSFLFQTFIAAPAAMFVWIDFRN